MLYSVDSSNQQAKPPVGGQASGRKTGTFYQTCHGRDERAYPALPLGRPFRLRVGRSTGRQTAYDR
jgi:hypothetical protein